MLVDKVSEAFDSWLVICRAHLRSGCGCGVLVQRGLWLETAGSADTCLYGWQNLVEKEGKAGLHEKRVETLHPAGYIVLVKLNLVDEVRRSGHSEEIAAVECPWLDCSSLDDSEVKHMCHPLSEVAASLHQMTLLGDICAYLAT